MNRFNPLMSVAELFAAEGAQLKDYEAACMAKRAAAMREREVCDDTGATAEHEEHVIGALSEYATLLRQFAELKARPREADRLLDAYLREAWAAIGAALSVLGGDTDKLQVAWCRLYEANANDAPLDFSDLVATSDQRVDNKHCDNHNACA